MPSPQRPGDSLDVDLDSEGRFLVSGLRSGVLSVEFTVHGRRPPLRRLDGIRVIAGAMTMDPVLQRVDLGALARSFVLTFLKPDAAPAAHLEVSLRETGSWEYRHTDDEGRLSLDAPTGAVDVLVNRAWRRAFWENVGTDRTFHLEPGLEVEVRLELGAQEFDSECEAHLALEGPLLHSPGAPPSARAGSDIVPVTGPRRYRFTVPYPRHYEPRLTLSMDTSTGRIRDVVQGLSPWSLDVTGSAAASACTVTVPAGEIAASVERLRKLSGKPR